MQAIHRKYDINYVKNALDVMQLTAIYYHQRVRERERKIKIMDFIIALDWTHGWIIIFHYFTSSFSGKIVTALWIIITAMWMVIYLNYSLSFMQYKIDAENCCNNTLHHVVVIDSNVLGTSFTSPKSHQFVALNVR